MDKEFDIDEAIEIETLTAVGLTVEQISYVSKIPQKKIQEVYKEQLQLGQSIIDAQIGKALIKKALAGDVKAMEKYLNVRAGWIEKKEVHHSGSAVTNQIAILMPTSESLEDWVEKYKEVEEKETSEVKFKKREKKLQDARAEIEELAFEDL